MQIKQVILGVAALVATACGSAPGGAVAHQYQVAGATISVREGSADYGTDLRWWLDTAVRESQTYQGTLRGLEMWEGLNIIMMPCDVALTNDPNLNPYEVMGLYYGDRAEILVRTCEWDISQTALPHELFEHRYPHVYMGNPNSEHAPTWHAFQLKIASRIDELMNAVN